MPSLHLVNKASLDRILQAEVYVNESDSQLRAAHLILGYNPISRVFQAPTCVIRARDSRLHRISVVYKGFVVPQGIHLPRYSPLTEPLPVATLAAGATSSPSPPFFQVEEEEEAEQEEEGFMDLTVSTDDYEVFNQPSPSQNVPEDMGIQRKPQRSLQELLESQPGRGEAEKPSQPKLPPPPPKSPPCAPQPPPPSKIEQVDLKRRREPKDKEVIEPRRPRSSSEEEAHRPSKQQRTSHAPSRGSERGDIQLPEPQAWLPAPMLGGEPLTDDASIRNFNGGIGCHVASVLEETLLLPRDMVEL